MDLLKAKKELLELRCEIIFEWNNVLDAWNGYLRRIGDTNGYIKCFIYDEKEESATAALIWSKRNRRSLEFYQAK